MKNTVLALTLVGIASTSIAAPLKANLSLNTDKDRLYARIHVKQKQDETGKIMIKWRAPKGSICINSTYTLPYKDKSWHTQSYRTVRFTHLDCTGTWHVSIWKGKQKLAAKKIVVK